MPESPAPGLSRKARGAFFTPPAIADYLADWAVGGDESATVLDPTCGEAVFLLAAAERLRTLGASPDALRSQVLGADLHAASVSEAHRLLRDRGLDATLHAADFFAVPTPDQLGCPFPWVDAVIGNPPFVRYQQHKGEDRRLSAEAALAQGVRLSGLASSWAALLVHACGFLKPEGRLAMVLPAELLTVHYAEPVRRWLRQRFDRVHLVFFERLQFEDAQENVVLVLAEGHGGCDAFSLYHVADAPDLADLGPFQNLAATPAASGKWTDLLLRNADRQLFKRVVHHGFADLDAYGSPALGTVTGANWYFTLNEATRTAYGLRPGVEVFPVSPPGTKHLKGVTFRQADWNALRDAGSAVWLLQPDAQLRSRPLARYVAEGEAQDVHLAYKCQVRSPWWRPPVAPKPDLFFTYMSHLYPRLVRNQAGVRFVNSMHGVRLRKDVAAEAKNALPLLCLNSVTMLGAEIFGRSYGGGVLKMEPTEAARLPMPKPDVLRKVWDVLKDERGSLDSSLRRGNWVNVVKRVDEVLLRQVLGLSLGEAQALYTAAQDLRERRTRAKTPEV